MIYQYIDCYKPPSLRTLLLRPELLEGIEPTPVPTTYVRSPGTATHNIISWRQWHGHAQLLQHNVLMKIAGLEQRIFCMHRLTQHFSRQ